MGMTGGLVRATLEEIARLRKHPSELPEFLDCGIWAPPNREVRPKGMLGWLLRLTPVRIYENDPDAVPPPGAEHAAIRPNIDLDKAWEPLHFLLTGTALEGEEPACYLPVVVRNWSGNRTMNGARTARFACSRQSRWRRSIDTLRH